MFPDVYKRQEYGDVQGIVTLNDVLAAIVGDYSVPEIQEEEDVYKRQIQRYHLRYR